MDAQTTEDRAVQWDRKGRPIMWERPVQGGWWYISADSTVSIPED